MRTVLLLVALGPALSLVAQAQTLPTPASASSAPTRAAAPPLTSRVVSYDPKDVVPLRTQIRYTTLIVLPVGEQILDVTCGDKEFWLVNATQNLCSLKPARPGAQTNLNLLTTSGTVYSFALTEVSHTPGAQPDLKVYVEHRDQALRPGTDLPPVFVPVQQVEEFRQQVELARLEVTRATERARLAEDAAHRATAAAEAKLADAIAMFRARYPLTLRFPYAFPRNVKPFRVTAIFHDDTCTYIRADASELPALYELKEGVPNLVQFDYRDGVYVVGKVLDRGYLAVGRQRFEFVRQEPRP